jgi:uroporphyrinogen-III synthase
MTRRVAVLRPEPGNRATVAALHRAGLETIALPLFEVVAIPWEAPDPEDHDGLLLTSANAVRCAGPQLGALAGLPVFAVGAATAEAARDSGLPVTSTGTEGVAEIVAAARVLGRHRLLHLAGRDRMPAPAGVTRTITVYDSRQRAFEPAALRPIAGQVALLHSPRAARRFAALCAGAIDRGTVRLAALSPTVADAAGTGWAEVAFAADPTDAALVALARRLAD